GADRLLAEQVGPDDQRPVDVGGDVAQPALRERAVLAYVLEAADRVVLPALRVAQVALRPAAGEQTVGWIGEQQLRPLVQRERLRRVAVETVAIHRRAS